MENDAIFRKSGISAVIIPALMFGILYSLLFLASMACIEPRLPVGLKGGYLSCILLFVVAPSALFVVGIVSGRIQCRRNPADRWLWRTYITGFLGGAIAAAVIIFGVYLNQYVPTVAPGLIPRLAFLLGIELFLLPLSLTVSAVFALFSLAGGYAVQWRETQRNECG